MKKEDQLRIRLYIEAELAKDAYNITIFQFPVLYGGTSQYQRPAIPTSSLLLLELLELDPNRGLI